MPQLPATQPVEPATPPSRVRYRVVGLLVLLAMVTYLDRACIGKLAPEIRRDLNLDEFQMSAVFSAFAFAYALFEIPTAWWADKIGTRTTLTRIVLWWSCFTMATAAAFSQAALVVTRFLFGAGEAGAWPCVARSFARWIPTRERGTVNGVFFAGAYLSGGLTPPLVVFMLPHMHWRWVFVCFGMTGFVWAAAWYWWFRDEPAQKTAVNAAELNLILAGRSASAAHVHGREFWLRLLRERNVLVLCLMYVPNSVTFYFCITWLPTYLNKRHGFDAAALGFVSGLPLMLSVASQFLGGYCSDRIVARYGLRAGRRIPGMAGYLVAALALFAAASAAPMLETAAGGAASAAPMAQAAADGAPSASPVAGAASAAPVAAAVLIAVATAACMFTTSSSWGVCVDIGREHSAVVSATMNTAGQVGSILSPFAVACSVRWFGDWDLPLYLLGGLFLLGAACWLFIDPQRPLFAAKAETGKPGFA